MQKADLSHRLSSFGLMFFGYCVAAALVAVFAEWPAQFGGPGDPTNVAGEFISRGTAMSPPLIPLVLLGVGSLLVRRRGWPLITGAIGLFSLGLLFVIGGFGEILAPDPVTTSRTVLVVGGVLAILGGMTLAILSGAALGDRFRSRTRRGKETQ